MHCDTPLDPHSPYEGFWWSHMGWLLDNKVRQQGEACNAMLVFCMNSIRVKSSVDVEQHSTARCSRTQHSLGRCRQHTCWFSSCNRCSGAVNHTA
jgi:hypothetical protein